MSTDLADSVAIITGGSRGIGRVLATRLAAEGAKVGLIARSGDQLATTAAELRDSGGVVATATADVADDKQYAHAVELLTDELGPLDLLVNNAAVDGPPGRAWEIDPDEWWRATEINLRSVLLGCRLAVPRMLDRGGGRIVNITSEAGVFRWPLMSAYSVSKAAVIKFTENIAVECKGTGVYVFSLHPGLTPVGFSEQERYLHADADSPEGQVANWVRGQIDAGHGADPAWSADLLVRVAHGDADELSGCHLSVHDDLDALIAVAGDVRRSGALMLRLNKAPLSG